MIKKLITFLVIASLLNSLNAQDITKEHFTEMRKTSFRVKYDIEQRDFNSLELFLKLNAIESEKLKNAVESGYDNKLAYTLPYFLLTEAPNKIRMVMIGYEVLDRINNEDFSRGKYYFVITSDITLLPEHKVVVYDNTEIITGDKDINAWWLSRYKSYITETEKVHAKFEFIPPPPPPPPKSLR